MNEFGKAAAAGGVVPAVNLAYAHALAGDRSKAEALLREMLDAPRPLPFALARLYLGLGDHERAIDSIERALAEGGGGPWFLAVNPAFDRLQSHRRYQAMMRRLGIRP